MIGLAQFVSEHRDAVQADLMKRGYTLSDIGGALSWDALDSFIAKTEPGSALSYELDPERAQWATLDGVNTLLADIYDLLAQMDCNIRALHTGKRQQKPRRHPRPGRKAENKHIGRASVPVDDVKNVIRGMLRRDGNGGKH